MAAAFIVENVSSHDVTSVELDTPEYEIFGDLFDYFYVAETTLIPGAIVRMFDLFIEEWTPCHGSHVCSSKWRTPSVGRSVSRTSRNNTGHKYDGVLRLHTL
jgi:hypothetical protein